MKSVLFSILVLSLASPAHAQGLAALGIPNSPGKCSSNAWRSTQVLLKFNGTELNPSDPQQVQLDSQSGYSSQNGLEKFAFEIKATGETYEVFTKESDCTIVGLGINNIAAMTEPKPGTCDQRAGAVGRGTLRNNRLILGQSNEQANSVTVTLDRENSGATDEQNLGTVYALVGSGHTEESPEAIDVYTRNSDCKVLGFALLGAELF